MDEEGTESDGPDLLEQARRNVSLAREQLLELIEQIN